MIMINLCLDGISIFGKSDGIDYCDFYYHDIMIIPIILPNSRVGDIQQISGAEKGFRSLRVLE